MRKNLDLSRPHFAFAEREVFYQPPEQALPYTDWKTPRLADLPSWRDAKVACLDVECRDEDLKRLGPGCRRDPNKNYVCGVGFAIEDGPQHYLPIKHDGGGNVEGDVWGYLRENIRDFNGIIVLNGGGYDLDWIANEVPEILTKKIEDVQVLDPLIYELHRKYNLNELCARYELPGKDETILRAAAAAYRIDPKKDLWRLPAKFVGPYGEIDARRPMQVRRRQIPIMLRDGIQQIWDLEKKVTPLLVRMRRRGVRIDIPHLQSVIRLAIMKEEENLAAVRADTGVTISRDDVWKPAVLAHALKAAGYETNKTEIKKNEKTGKTTGGKDSVDQDFLKTAGKVGKLILRARKWNKLRTTFCAQVEEALVGDRVHCTFNQLKTSDEDDSGDGKGVRYGRLSSSNFNIQQMPIRDEEFGELFRRIFVADLGARWGCSDWSQQEPRIGVHYAEILKLQGAREFADEYRKNPRLDIHAKLTEIGLGVVYDETIRAHKDKRTEVKNYVNGRLYGMGDLKLCHHMRWSTEMRRDPRTGEYREFATAESKAKIDELVSFAPWIPGLTREAARAAEKNGCVWTWLRRKCHFEKGPDGKIWKAHKAFNRIGQGTAADQMKATLVACYDEGIDVQLAVHDEFDLSFDDIRVPLRVKELQMTVVQFNVPMMVDLEIGPSWGALKKYVAEMSA